MTRHAAPHARCQIDRTLPAKKACVEATGLGAGMRGLRLSGM